MAYNLVFASVALVAVVFAGPGDHVKRGGAEAAVQRKQHGGDGPKGPHGGPHGGHHGGPHGGPPAFLANVSAEGKKEFETVFKNENLTLAQIETQVAALAEKYGVSALYKEFEANRTAHMAEIKKNTTAVISNLSSIASQLETIFSNKDQTRKAQHEAVDALRKDHRVEVDAVHFISENVGGRGRHGHGGPRGGHHGGKGHGGEHGGKKGPHGGEHAKGNKVTKDAKQ